MQKERVELSSLIVMKTHLGVDEGAASATRPDDGKGGTLGTCGVRNEVKVYLGSGAGSFIGETGCG
jgi:hypothetical protein